MASSIWEVNWKRWKVKTISCTECVLNDTWLCFLWNWLLRRFGLVPSGSLKQHPFHITMFVYLSPSNRSLFPCIVNSLAFVASSFVFFVFFLTSVISCPLFSPDKWSELTIISNYLWPNNVDVWDSQTLSVLMTSQSLSPPGPTLWRLSV